QASDGGAITFQTGVNGSDTIAVNTASMHSSDIITGTIDISTRGGASTAIAAIESAIEAVSVQRAEFGAVQNRLEHTINNLGVNKENLSAAHSRIRDADMASEMTTFTKNQI